jgi:hypothetical protein
VIKVLQHFCNLSMLQGGAWDWKGGWGVGGGEGGWGGGRQVVLID